jgi:prepilin peptidase CpaA
MLVAIIFVVFPFCMVFAAVSDLLSMTIANRVALLLAGTFLIVAPLTGMPWDVYAWHVAAGVLVLAITFALFAVGGMGGGDAKLLAATSLYFGLGFGLVQYLVISAGLGGLLTIAILLYRNSPVSMISGHNVFLRNLADTKVGIPYGIALGAGGLLMFPTSPLAIWALERLAAG